MIEKKEYLQHLIGMVDTIGDTLPDSKIMDIIKSTLHENDAKIEFHIRLLERYMFGRNYEKK